MRLVTPAFRIGRSLTDGTVRGPSIALGYPLCAIDKRACTSNETANAPQFSLAASEIFPKVDICAAVMKRAPASHRGSLSFAMSLRYSAGITAVSGSIVVATPAASRRPSFQIALIRAMHIMAITTENGSAPITIAV